MQPTIPVIVCIDVEPDGPVNGRDVRPAWSGYEKSRDFFNGLRVRLASATGSQVHFSWFYRMDPQIADLYGSGAWPVTAYRAYADDFVARGDEAGLHTHLYRYDEGRGDWIIDNGNTAWVRHCIESSCACFEAAFNRPAACHRFGDRFFDSTALGSLVQAGCGYDLSLEPGFKEHPGSDIARLTTGALPDMSDVPDAPYRPAPDDVHRPAPSASGGLWLIPLGTGRVGSGFFNLFGPRRWYPLHLGLDSRLFAAIAGQLLRRLSRPYIGIVLKTDMLLEPRLADAMRSNLEFFMRSRSSSRFVFATPREAMRRLGYER